jgi:pimeloyl-ACP methyl ester carboxylesterase
MPAEIWEPQIAHFAKTHRVVAMDPRSQGLSSQTGEGNYPEARARDIKAVVDGLKLAPAVLVGWSMGVTELAAYVDQFGCDSVAGLVLVDGRAGYDMDSSLTKKLFERAASFQKNRQEAGADFVRGMYKRPQSEEYLQRITRASLRTPTNTAMALLLAMVSTDRRSALAKISKPTLIVVAQGPYQMIFEDMQRRIAGSQLKVMDGVGHALFVDEADKFNSLLDGFLKGL